MDPCWQSECRSVRGDNLARRSDSHYSTADTRHTRATESRAELVCKKKIKHFALMHENWRTRAENIKHWPFVSGIKYVFLGVRQIEI